MNQKQIDQMAEALRSQGLTWAQTNFAVSLVRNHVGAAVTAERERWRPAAEMTRAALSDLLMTRDPVVYSDALRALDAVLMPNDRIQPPASAGRLE
jgi:hypothetical protein